MLGSLDRPPTRYATNGEVSLAYQVFGAGPLDLLLTTGWVPSMDSAWDEPAYCQFLGRLGAFSRVILWDKRGTGLSDRVPPDRLPTVEERMEDLTAVLDAAESERAAIVGLSEGAPMSVMFAATYPDRASHLVLYGGWAASFADEDDDFPGIMPVEAKDAFSAMVLEHWSDMTPLLGLWAPSRVGDDRFAEGWARSLRTGASPAAAIAWLEMSAQIDVRAVLPAVGVPTLVLNRTGDKLVSPANSAYLAGRIPGARHVELPGDDHLWWAGDVDAIADEIEEFVTGALQSTDRRRALVTVLFTDIVGSTDRVVSEGDRRWRDLLETHDRLVRAEITRFGGRAVKSLGDGFLAAFEGPARAIRCASEIQKSVASAGLAVRTGIHTGECEVIGDDVAGLAVHIGARIGACAESGEVRVSQTVRDLVAGSGIEFSDRGLHELKGVPGEWRLFAIA
jgi:class 3 adenylate cyclase